MRRGSDARRNAQGDLAAIRRHVKGVLTPATVEDLAKLAADHAQDNLRSPWPSNTRVSGGQVGASDPTGQTATEGAARDLVPARVARVFRQIAVARDLFDAAVAEIEALRPSGGNAHGLLRELSTARCRVPRCEQRGSGKHGLCAACAESWRRRKVDRPSSLEEFIGWRDPRIDGALERSA